jgi:hypothetical protein
MWKDGAAKVNCSTRRSSPRYLPLFAGDRESRACRLLGFVRLFFLNGNVTPASLASCSSCSLLLCSLRSFKSSIVGTDPLPTWSTVDYIVRRNRHEYVGSGGVHEI